MNVQALLAAHAGKYPAMQPSDAVKLLYQRVFGCGHMVRSGTEVLARLEEEYSRMPHPASSPTVESLGDVSRFYLDAPLSPRERRLLARIFTLSANLHAKGYTEAPPEVRDEFRSALDEAGRMASRGELPFSAEALEAYLSGYIADGCPAVSHSDGYRAAYFPSYRVIDGRYARLFPILNAIDKRLDAGLTTVIAIDGRCASGKTTAAAQIAEFFGAPVVHMDDFFLPFDQRPPERMAEPGGNLHRERFIEEVLPHLGRGESFDYRVFACHIGDYTKEPRHIPASQLVICEGSYALHPAFGDYCDLRIFSTVDPEEQLRRIRIRDGEAMSVRFQRDWIPMEERYFSHFAIEESCPFVLK